ncbi:MAG: hypothetical protein V3U44_01405 [Alphaproteobacteria bacterium]
MRKTLFGAITAAFLVGVSPSAWAFGCPVSFQAADEAIAMATTAMKAMSDKDKMGQVHTLIDDAKMLLTSGKHNHEKAAAGALDHARAIAKARAAAGYAQAAEIMAKS